MQVSARSHGTAALVAASVVLLSGAAARATGVAGDRLFPSTLTIEDTQNDDELDLPTVRWLRRGANGDNPAARDLGISSDFSRLLTPDLAVLMGTGWRRLETGAGASSGWDNAEFGLKYRTVVDEPHEFLMSTAIVWEIGGSGAERTGAERFETVQPVVSVGKGFGDLPREAEWLRPAALTGAVGLALPTGAGAKTLRYGAALQYSMIYRDQHTGLGTPDWTKQLVPLVEFAVETPIGSGYGFHTVATAAPGIAWIGEECQVTVEALVPLNSHTGRGVGAIAQLHLFLDEMMPALFGKTLLTGETAGR